MNSIAVYAGDAIFPWFVGGRDADGYAMFFWGKMDNNLGMWIYSTWFRSYISENVSNLLWALLDVTWWVLVAAVLYWQKIFFKI